MGFRVNEICYVDTASALQAFQNLYPFFGASTTSAPYVLISSSINEVGLISYTQTADLVSTSGTLQLSSCTTPANWMSTPFGDISQSDLILIIAVMFAVIIGFGHGSNLGKEVAK